MGNFQSTKGEVSKMPTRLLDKGEIETALDFDKEIIEPKKKGYYLEVIARLDAYVDYLLDSVVSQIYSTEECAELIDFLELSLRQEFVFFSGMVKLDLLKRSSVKPKHSNLVFPPASLRKKIKSFKELRNKILHSNIGHYNLLDENDYLDDSRFQRDAENKVLETVDLGIQCYNELKDVLRDNQIVLEKLKK